MWRERCRNCQGFGTVQVSASTLWPEIRRCRQCQGSGSIWLDDGEAFERQPAATATPGEGDR